MSATGDVPTTVRYWDCECPTNKRLPGWGYIHSAKEASCRKCGAEKDEQPDSRVSEVRAAMRDGKIIAPR